MGFLASPVIGNSSTSNSSSNQHNQAYDYLQNALAPSVSTGSAATQAQANLLGVGSDPAAQQQAFQNYLGSTGYQFQQQQGQQAITNSAAAQGLLNSGATLKAADAYNQNLGSQYFQNYLSQLGGLSNTGLQGAGIIGGAGTVSSSSEQKGSGLGSIFGML